MFHADKLRGTISQFSDRIQCDGYGGPAGDVVDHPRQFMRGGDFEVVFDQTALRRPDVIRRDDQQRIDTGVNRVGGQSLRFGE